MYVYEFEFFPSNGYIDAVPCGDWGEGTFGDDLADAVESAADAARTLGVSPARVLQLIADGALDSWRDGSRRMVSKASVGARIEYAPAPGHPTLSAGVQGHT
ncbi:MAG: helix-turn-helix domain-containing protein [Coriobacteriaceae bacterium]|nr:helix-turn-helix domain-containing protein [Coriobacteriaceae bacterium]